MHEASLMAGLVRKINAAAEANRARRIVGVTVRLGALTHMSAEHFTEHFKRATAGTVADGARLDLTLSDDIRDADAQAILLQSLEVET